MEFIGEFASRLPLITICQLLGVPTSDWALLRDWSARLLPNNPNQVPAADRAVTEFRDYVQALIRQRRRSPSEDLVSALTAAASDGKLTPEELWILITLLVSHPDQLKLLKDQPETYIDTAIEELLRLRAARLR
jgi:cytochrome P450